MPRFPAQEPIPEMPGETYRVKIHIRNAIPMRGNCVLCVVKGALQKAKYMQYATINDLCSSSFRSWYAAVRFSATGENFKIGGFYVHTATGYAVIRHIEISLANEKRKGKANKGIEEMVPRAWK